MPIPASLLWTACLKDTQETMILAMASFRIRSSGLPTFWGQRREQDVREIFALANDANADCLLFAGWTAHLPDASVRVEGQIKRLFASESAAVGTSAFYELGSGDINNREYFLAQEGRSVPLGPQQCTKGEHDEAEGMAEVKLALQGRSSRALRRFEIAGNRIALLVCGEDSILKKNRTTGAISMRTVDSNRSESEELKELLRLDYEILVNPWHSPKGELHNIYARSATLSSAGRWCIAISNWSRAPRQGMQGRLGYQSFDGSEPKDGTIVPSFDGPRYRFGKVEIGR